jgi:hypothetical protein
MEITLALVFIFAAIGILTTTALVRVYVEKMNTLAADNQRLLSEVSTLRTSNAILEERVKNLETMRPKTVSEQSWGEIMNGITALATLKHDMEIRDNLLNNALEHFNRAITPNRKKG